MSIIVAVYQVSEHAYHLLGNQDSMGDDGSSSHEKLFWFLSTVFFCWHLKCAVWGSLWANRWCLQVRASCGGSHGIFA